MFATPINDILTFGDAETALDRLSGARYGSLADGDGSL